MLMSPRGSMLLMSPVSARRKTVPLDGDGDLGESLVLSEEGMGPLLTAAQVVFNLANIIMGVGVLSIPYALRQSGYFALVLIAVVISITTKTAKWIGSAMELASDSTEAALLPRAFWDFGFLAEVAFGPRAAVTINVVTVLEIWLALVAFMVMNGGNAAIVMPSVSNLVTIPVFGFLGTVGCFVPHSVFAYLSLFSSFAMIVAAFSMVISTSIMGEWAEPSGNAALFRPENIPRSIGIILFCFAGHPCFPSVLVNMENEKKWGFCVDLSFLIAFAYYTAFGFLGYVVFGPLTSPSLVTNIATISGAMLWRYVAAFCFLLKIQLTIPPLMNAVLVACWKPGEEDGESRWPLKRILLLFLISGITMLAAMASADALAVLASLSGSLFINITSVLFPAVVHFALRRKRGLKKRMTFASMIPYIVVIGFGVVQAILGTFCAVQDTLAGVPTV